MTMFVVMFNVRYEGGTIRGLFRSHEKALAAKAEIESKSDMLDCSVEILQVVTGRIYDEYGPDVVQDDQEEWTP